MVIRPLRQIAATLASKRGQVSASATPAVKVLAARARAASSDRRFAAAALLYDEALRLLPDHGPFHLQCGHMHKEAGDLASAEKHYQAARRLMPDDAEVALQLGHFYKVAGRPAESQRAYHEAVRLRPGWDEPARELRNLHDAGWRGHRMVPADPDEFGRDVGAALRHNALGGRSAAELSRLVPSLVPRPYEDLLHEHSNLIDVRRLGRREVGYWGRRRTLRGVEAIRGFCVSDTPIVEVHVILNGLALYRGPLRGGYTLKFERDKQRFKKYVFNIWLDFSVFARGLHTIELRFFDMHDETRSFGDQVVIAEPVGEAEYPGSDALVNVPPDDPRSLEEQIRARPTMVRSARRALFSNGVRSILVMRTDQLGDMVASIPAVRRLREIVPGARLVGLLTAANADLARTLGLFDEVIVADFPDDRTERRRLMPLDVQEELRRTLEPYTFDIAIDLAQASVSRDLLLLSGAKFLYGTGGEDWPWLSADVIFNTHDRWNAMDTTPHSTKVLALVECLGTLLKTSAPIIRRSDLRRDVLVPYGILRDQRFAVLHTGARIPFSRWPHYAEVAAMLIERTDLKVVMMADDPSVRAAVPAGLLAHHRLVFIDARLPFDHFDAFMSFATVMAGNDSGPKHLASLRGTPVVTLFTARINWTEWGQENVGVIMSRRVPCAGCAIFHDDEECGRDFACIVDIRPDEVFAEIIKLVGHTERAGEVMA